MLRLRQVAFVATDLAQAESDLERTLDLSLCHRDPGLIEFGLHNALFPVGDRFLEIVSPLQEETTAGRLLDKRGGDGGYMVIFQVDDLKATTEHLDELGTRVVYVANGEAITGLHIHPKDMPGAIVSIDESEVPAAWPWAGYSWTSREPSAATSDLVGVTLQVEDPADAARRWAAVLERPVGGTEAEPVVNVDDGYLRFVPVSDGRGPGLSAIDVVPTDPERVGDAETAVGVTINYVSELTK